MQALCSINKSNSFSIKLEKNLIYGRSSQAEGCGTRSFTISGMYGVDTHSVENRLLYNHHVGGNDLEHETWLY